MPYWSFICLFMDIMSEQDCSLCFSFASFVAPSGLMKAKEGTFKSVFLKALFLKFMKSLVIGTNFLALEITKGNSNRLYILGIS